MEASQHFAYVSNVVLPKIKNLTYRRHHVEWRRERERSWEEGEMRNEKIFKKKTDSEFQHVCEWESEESVLGCVAAAVAFFFSISQSFFFFISSTQSPDDDDDDRFDVVIRKKYMCVHIKKRVRDCIMIHKPIFFLLLFLLIFHRLPPIPKQDKNTQSWRSWAREIRTRPRGGWRDDSTTQRESPANWSNNFNSHSPWSRSPSSRASRSYEELKIKVHRAWKSWSINAVGYTTFRTD